MSLSIRERLAAIPLARRAYGRLAEWTVRSGTLGLCHALTRRRHVILTFHRVRPAGVSSDPFDTCPSMSVDVFRHVLKYIKDRFAVVPLIELCENLAGNETAVAVTFDDGWRDNYDLAFPALRELGIPATIFVTTGKIGSCQLFWQQELGRASRAAAASPDQEKTRQLRSLLQLQDGQPVTPEVYQETAIRWKGIGRTERERLIDCLGRILPLDSGLSRSFLNAEEIREMAAAGIDFGSHTVTHSILPQLPPAEIQRELAESKTVLENLLGRPVVMLAYPNGQHSPEVLQCARVVGYCVGCTTRSRRLSRGDDCLCLPRSEVTWERVDTLDEFCRFGFQWQTR